MYIGSMFYITTPIPYTNATPHLGHLLEGVFTDTIARFYARTETDGGVFLQMGVDQHGLKIYEKSVERGVPTQQFVDQLSQKYRDMWSKYDVMYDVFVETSSQEHKIVSQLVWKKLQEKGYIYKKKYKGLYCKGCEDFYAPSQLIDGNCPVHGTKPIQMNEENYFFALSKFNGVITNYLQKGNIHPSFIAKEQLNFVTEGLEDVSISRDISRLPWGITVPDDNSQVMYVWFEALINYLTALVDTETIEQEIEFPGQFETEVWSEIRARLPIDLMYISKEIAKFHLVIFIAILSALDLPLPLRVLAHGLINDSDGRKFSKSLSNGVTPKDMENKFGTEGTRFLILHDINIDGDTSFDWGVMTESYNAHLANNIGNLLMRVTTLVEKYLDGIVDFEDINKKLYDFDQVYTHMQSLNTKLALEEVLKGARWGNEYLESKKPWVLAKEGRLEELKEVLTTLCVHIRDLAEVLSIFLPLTGEKINSIITSERITKAEPLFAKVDVV